MKHLKLLKDVYPSIIDTYLYQHEEKAKPTENKENERIHQTDLEDQSYYNL